MFQWTKLKRFLPKTGFSSIAQRVTILSVISILLLSALSLSTILDTVNKTVEGTVNEGLVSYLDVLISITKIGKNDNIILPEGLKIPRYWQITEGDNKIAKSAMLVKWLTVEGSRKKHIIGQYFDGELYITAAERTVKLANNRNVTFLIGLPTRTIETYKDIERAKFTAKLLKVIAIFSALLIAIVYVQVRISMAPLNDIKEALKDVRKGDKSVLAGDYPDEVKPLVDELNALIIYTTGIITRYQFFASNLSHALRAPLCYLNMNSGKGTETVSAKMVNEKSGDMLDLIDRNLARVKAVGGASIIGVETDCTAVTNKIARSFGKLHDKEVNVECEDGIIFRGHEADYYEMLGNLIENACKYSKSKVEVNIKTLDEELYISVEDDGDGIPEEEYESILERGMRLDENIEGSGIGLPISKEIVELYNGKLELKTSELGGLKIIITLPIPS